jgi:hypothetical protein
MGSVAVVPSTNQPVIPRRRPPASNRPYTPPRPTVMGSMLPMNWGAKHKIGRSRVRIKRGQRVTVIFA